MRRVSLDEALELMLENNAELVYERSRVEDARGAVEQSSAYFNPEAAVSHESLSGSSRSYSETYFTVSQRFYWPSRRRARRDSEEYRLAAESTLLAAETARLAFAVQRTYAEASASERRVEIAKEVQSVFRRAETAGGRRFAQGDLSGYDLRRLRIERARYEDLVVRLEREATDLRRRLATLILPDVEGLQMAPDAPLRGRPPARLEATAAEIVTAAYENRPEIQAARSEVRAAEASVDFYGSFSYPDLSVTGGYKTQSDGLDGFFVAVSAPLPLFDRRQGDITSASARLSGARSRLALSEISVEADVLRARDAYDAALTRVRVIEEQLLQETGDLLDIALVSYREGEMTLLELLDAADAFRDSQTLLVDLTTELWIAHFDLERARGATSSALVADGDNQ